MVKQRCPQRCEAEPRCTAAPPGLAGWRLAAPSVHSASVTCRAHDASLAVPDLLAEIGQRRHTPHLQSTGDNRRERGLTGCQGQAVCVWRATGHQHASVSCSWPGSRYELKRPNNHFAPPSRTAAPRSAAAAPAPGQPAAAPAHAAGPRAASAAQQGWCRTGGLRLLGIALLVGLPQPWNAVPAPVCCAPRAAACRRDRKQQQPTLSRTPTCRYLSCRPGCST